MNEVWKEIPGYEGFYEASNLGRVRSMERWVRASRTTDTLRLSPAKLRSLSTKKSGHIKVSLYREGKERTHHVHSLVLTTFVGPRPEGKEACHNNGVPSDNSLTNLRWDTKRENNLDKGRHGTDHKRNRTHCPRGHELKQPNLVNGDFLKGYRNCKACSRERARSHGKSESFDINLSNIQYHRILQGM